MTQVDAAIETGREVVQFSKELWVRLNAGSPDGMEGEAGEGGVGQMSFDQLLASIDSSAVVRASVDQVRGHQESRGRVGVSLSRKIRRQLVFLTHELAGVAIRQPDLRGGGLVEGMILTRYASK